MSPLTQSILRTLAFFDALDVPLTLLELRAYLVRVPGLPAQISLADLESEAGRLSGQVVLESGFYHLRGREDLVAARAERYKISLRRFRKCRLLLRVLRHFPYIRAVAVSGSQAMLNSNPESDIDLFFIIKQNRIWLARVFISFYFQIMGQRRHGPYVRGRFCLNHYVREGMLLSSDRNLYTAVIYTNLLPVIGQEAVARFWQNNSWIRDFLFAPPPPGRVPFFNLAFSRPQRVLEALLDYSVGPFLNSLASIYQKRRIRLQEHIIVSDEELSFHPGSRGQRVLAKFQKNQPQTLSEEDEIHR